MLLHGLYPTSIIAAVAVIAEQVPTTAGPLTSGRHRWRQMALAFVWFLVVTAYATWPLVRFAPSRVAGDLKDPLENAWIFGWGAHAIVRQPLHLFDANIFHPEPYGLAYAENMLGLSLPVAPIFWLTHNPVLAVNVALLFTCAVAGLGVFLLVREATCSVAVAVLAGTAYAVAPYRLAQVTHLHVVATHLTPFVLFVLLRLTRAKEGTSVRRCVGVLALLVALQFWASLTGGIITMIAVGTWGIWEVARRRRAAGRVLLHAGTGVVLGILLSLPVVAPYAALRRLHPTFWPSPSTVRYFSATPGSYLSPRPPGDSVMGAAYERLRGRFRHGSDPTVEKELFPGFFLTGGGIAVIGMLAISGVRSRRRDCSGGGSADAFGKANTALVGLGLAIAAAGFVLSLGPRYGGQEGGLPLPFAAVAAVAGGMTRVPARLGMLVPLGLAIAIGVALGACGRRTQRVLIPLGAFLLLVEVAPPSIPVIPAPVVTDAHRALVDRPGAVMALPTADFDGSGTFSVQTLDHESIPRESVHMYLSTSNFRPLVNGYGAYFPDIYWDMARVMQDFPSDAAFSELGRRDVRTLVVQTELLPGTRWEGVVPVLRKWAGVKQIGEGRGVRTYDISGANEAARPSG